jgi:hypothetical protein
MRYEIPQFIDVEDKLFGPFTFKQFIYMVGGAGLCYLWSYWFPLPVAIAIIVPTAVFAWALAFAKVNTRPFIEITQAFITYTLRGKSYLWKRINQEKIQNTKQVPVSTPIVQPSAEDVAEQYKNTERRIGDLAESLDLLDQN